VGRMELVRHLINPVVMIVDTLVRQRVNNTRVNKRFIRVVEHITTAAQTNIHDVHITRRIIESININYSHGFKIIRVE